MSAADVSPARASKSASWACTFEPIANPKFVLAVDALSTSDRLLLPLKNPLAVKAACVHAFDEFLTNN